ncbi:lytic murein transglycosylase [Oryzibacter oryziterrae]|uniref:lytic murein transglycosylase n=1 Tax=Oryzibacter oryziterrae TaxID=2766474 RepID=UPI001F2DE486|nr:lytic murein transglycosylase [Oryzibacter oryziterrae]
MIKRLALSLLLALAACPARAADPFQAWLAATVWPKAQSAGVSRATFDAAIAGLTPDTGLPDLGPKATDFQAEFRSPAGYLDAGKLAAQRSIAARKVAANKDVLASIQKATGVPPGIVVAVWAKESAYGAAALPKSAIRTLATQAYMGSRKAEFLPELIAALQILDSGEVSLKAMKSSWAGALGQPQFMPSKFRDYAVDQDGDGRRDIWTSTPDVLGSIAHFLALNGWKAGVPVGTEVRLPPSVSCTLEGPDQGQPIASWTGADVTRADGSPVTSADVGPVGHLLLPAGRYGPAFLVSDNFYVLKTYNESDVYALWVRLVGDKLVGKSVITATWSPPQGFSRGDVRSLQKRLEAMGHDVGTADGLVGFRTRVAIGRWQQAHGLPVTCYPDKATIAALK